MIALTKKGIYNVMAWLKMIDQPVQKMYEDQFIVTKRKFPSSHRGGLLQGLCRAGQILQPGEPFARIFNVFEDVEVIKADSVWLPLGIGNDPVIDSGNVIGAVALEWHPVEQ